MKERIFTPHTYTAWRSNMVVLFFERAVAWATYA